MINDLHGPGLLRCVNAAFGFILVSFRVLFYLMYVPALPCASQKMKHYLMAHCTTAVQYNMRYSLHAVVKHQLDSLHASQPETGKCFGPGQAQSQQARPGQAQILQARPGLDISGCQFLQYLYALVTKFCSNFYKLLNQKRL